MTKQSKSGTLVINCGSSSLKFSWYNAASLTAEWSGSISPIGSNQGKLEIKTAQHKVLASHTGNFKNMQAAVAEVIRWLKESGGQDDLSVIGHRLVQGGPEHRAPEIITPKLLKTLRGFVYLAPNHLPDELKTISLFQQAFPGIPQVACFDTAFHKDMPAYANEYPLPQKYKDQGLLRYGFHGLSYQYVLEELTKEYAGIRKKKIIIAHLGNGASMAAVKDGISVDTTMGISPTGGLVMSTRSGDLDPGVLLFLLKQGGLTPGQLDELLSKDAGLKAIAGTGDVQELLKTTPDDPKAVEALTVFCYAAKKFIGALAAAMGGLDLLVFTGGIGENSAIIRERICQGLEFMGIDLAKAKNTRQAPLISKKNSRVTVRVIPTNEELMIARLSSDLLNDKKTKDPHGKRING